MGRKLHDSEKDVRKREDRDANRDPLTGSPGSHPVGVGVGAAGGAAAGAAAGTIAGPAGALLGAAVGAVAGAVVGKAAAEAIDPTVEEAYWKEHYATEPCYEPGRSEKRPLREESRAPALAAWNRIERIIPSEAGHGHEKS